MSTYRFLFRRLPACFLLTAACASESGRSAPDEAFVRACMDSSNMSEALCSCVAEKAQEELTEDGYQFLLASLEEREDDTARLRQEMPVQELMKAGMFMASAPATCARGEVEE